MVVAFLVSQTARLDKLSLGVRVRVQFMSPLKSASLFSGNYTSTGTRFSAGPTVEVQVANRFAVAFEALRLTYRYEQQPILTPMPRSKPFKGMQLITAWEFPLILKKYVAADANMGICPEAGFCSTPYECQHTISKHCPVDVVSGQSAEACIPKPATHGSRR